MTLDSQVGQWKGKLNNSVYNTKDHSKICKIYINGCTSSGANVGISFTFAL